MAKKKKWVQKAIKHPGRLTEAAARAGVSKMQEAEKWSHSSDPSKRGAGILGKRLMKGKLHAGGTVGSDGMYELQKGEKVLPNPGAKHYITQPGGHGHDNPVAPGHVEADGMNYKFCKA